MSKASVIRKIFQREINCMSNNCILCGSNNVTAAEEIKGLIEKYLQKKFYVKSVVNHIINQKSCINDLHKLEKILQRHQTNLPASVYDSGLVGIEDTFNKVKVDHQILNSNKLPIRNVNAFFRSFRRIFPNHKWCSCLKDLNQKAREKSFQEVVSGLQITADKAKERLVCVVDISVSGKLNKSNAEISIHVSLSNKKIIRRSFTGKSAITESESYIESVTDDGLVNYFNISTLDSDSKIESYEGEIFTFIKNNFYDFKTVTDIKLVTAKDIHPNDRAKIYLQFKSADRYMCLISLMGDRLLRTTFRHLKSRVEKPYGKWLHYMGDKHYFIDKAVVYAFKTQPLLSNVSAIDVKKISEGKKTKKVTIKYGVDADSIDVTLKYGDYMFKRMQDFYYYCIDKSNLNKEIKKQSVIFYAWVAKTRTKVDAKKTSLVCKFGLTFTASSKKSICNERNTDLVKDLIEKRKADYIRSHSHSFNFDKSSSSIILYSIGDSQDNGFQALKKFEAYLKRADTFKESDEIKLQPSGASNISAKELLYSEKMNANKTDFIKFIDAQYKKFFENTKAPDLIVSKQ